MKETEDLIRKIETIETYEDKLSIWAEFALEYCNKVAIEKNRTFYCFQSPPKQNPEVLILGLNPAGDYSFENQIKSWNLKNGIMTTDVFLNQNPWYKGGVKAHENNKEWNILKKFGSTINIDNELSKPFENMCYMNILYFNSVDFSEFKRFFKSDWNKIYNSCITLSKILIEQIIKPKRIICLGIDNCYNSFIGNSDSLELLKDRLYKSEVNNVNVYGITHPSARIPNSIREEIGWSLYSDWFNTPIKSKLKSLLSKINSILLEIASDNNLKLDFECISNLGAFSYFKFYFIQNSNISIYFEFQKGFYGNLKYAMNNKKDKALINAITCEKPFDNWTQLINSFDEKQFKNYFETIITNQVKLIYNLK